MALELHNSWEYDGDKQNWWHWSAYIVGDDISNVASVEYILHPTFKKPLRSVDDPTGGFRMDTSGWGTFDLKAIVHKKDGKTELLTHDLILEVEPPIGRTDRTDEAAANQ